MCEILVSYCNNSKNLFWLDILDENLRKKKSYRSVKKGMIYSENALFINIFFIQFNVPFNIISIIETSQSIGGAKREHPGKTT